MKYRKNMLLNFFSIICLIIIASCGSGSGKGNGSNTPPITQDKSTLTLLSDLNIEKKPLSSGIWNITEFNGHLYFGGSSEATGSELWRYNGSDLELAADIVAGNGSSSPRYFETLDDYLYFSALDPDKGSEIYRTDGLNTELVADITPGRSSSSPRNLKAFNGYVYFTVNKNIDDYRLWRTNGNVTEPVAGTENLSLYIEVESTIFNNALYFAGDLNNSGTFRLWRIKGGTAELFSQTTLSKDITVSPSSHNFITYGGQLYFSAKVEGHGYELLRTDGTTIEMFADIFSGSGDSYPDDFVEYDGQLYFTATTSTSGAELWRTNGSKIEQVVDIESGTKGSRPDFKTILNNQLFFRATTSASGSELWKTDGSKTVQVADIKSGSGGSAPRYFAVYKNYLFFVADDGINGSEIWRTDGMTTELFADIDKGLLPGGSEPSNLFVFNSELYFEADDGVNAREYWKTDGVTTQIAFQSNSTIATESTLFTSFSYHNNDLYFITEVEGDGDNDNDFDIWRSSDNGAQHISKANSRDLVVYNGEIHYAYYDETTSSNQLWHISADGIKKVTITTNDENIYPGGFFVFNDDLYFSAKGNHGSELWRYNGTSVEEFADINPGTGSSSPSNYHIFNNKLYFTATTASTGREIWNTDGTSVSILKDIKPNSASSTTFLCCGAQQFVNFKGLMYFAADDGVNGVELWQTDGTNTSLVLNINPEQANGLTSNFNPFIAGNWMYFSAYITGQGTQLWRTNGQTTEIVDSSLLGFQPDYAKGLITFNSQFYYFTYDENTRARRLYRLDDTMDTAERIDLSIAGIDELDSFKLFEHNNQLFIYKSSSTAKKDLWRINTTGIEYISKLTTSSGVVDIQNLHSAGTRLYLEADDLRTGNELWYIDL